MSTQFCTRVAKSVRLSAMLTLIFVVSAWAQTMLLHNPPSQSFVGRDLLLQVSVEPPAPVIFMQVFYRRPGENSYREAMFAPNGNEYVARIRGQELNEDGLEYFISALLANDNVITFPAFNPYKQPILLPVIPPHPTPQPQPEPEAALIPPPELQVEPNPVSNEPQNTPASVEPEEQLNETESDSDNLLVLSPDEGAVLSAAEVVLAVSFLTEPLTDSLGIQLFLDGREVTDEAEISSVLLSYVPQRIEPGKHWFKLVVPTDQGILEAKMIHFTVIAEADGMTDSAAAEHRPSFSGSAFAEGRLEQIADNDESYLFAGGRFDGQTGPLQYNAVLFLTSLEDRSAQSRNRYSFSIGTKWLGLSAGDTYPRYNDLILWGKRIRGVSAYLRLGFFNLEMTVGQPRRAVEGDSLKSKLGTFSRNTFAVRPSFGSGKNFQLGLTLVKSRDDSTSIAIGGKPLDNIVVGPDLRLSLDRGRLVFAAVGAMSITTADISGGPIDKDDIDRVFEEEVDLPIDPKELDRYLIINDSTYPINPLEGTSTAWNVSLRLNYFRNLLHVGYKSIGSQYYSLTNDWIRTDIAGFYFSDRLRLFSNKLYLTLGYENFKDNLAQEDASPSVDLQTLNYSLSWYPGTGYPYISASLQTHYRDNGIDALRTFTQDLGSEGDSSYVLDFRDNQKHRDLSLNIGYDLNLWSRVHALQFSLLNSAMQDRFKSTRPIESQGFYAQEYSTDLWMISWSSQLQQNLRTTAQFAANRNSVSEDSDYRYQTFGGMAEWSFLQRALTAFGELRYTSSENSFELPSSNGLTAKTTSEYSRLLFRFGGWWQINRSMRLTIDSNIYSIQQTNGIDPQKTDYSDRIFRLRYEKLF